MNNNKLYYSIGEVAEMLNVNTSLLRFWEKEFNIIKPTKNKKGTRSYTKDDIEILKRIHYLTKECGFTLDGAKEQLKNNKLNDKTMDTINTLNEVRTFLLELKQII